jgi:hypothetical protein
MKAVEIKEMKALSVKQPWAYCIIHKGQNVENREWYRDYRGTIAIHASKPKSMKEIRELCEFAKKDYNIKIDMDELAYGAVIGFADLVDVITKKDVNIRTRKWFQGKYGFVLKNIIVLKTPVVIEGGFHLGFWKLEGKELKACLKQLSTSQIRKFREFKKIE